MSKILPDILFSLLSSSAKLVGKYQEVTPGNSKDRVRFLDHLCFTEHYRSLSTSKTSTYSNVVVSQSPLNESILSSKEDSRALGGIQKIFWEKLGTYLMAPSQQYIKEETTGIKTLSKAKLPKEEMFRLMSCL